MEKIKVKTIKSGDEEEYFWIGLFLETDFDENDNLLILCGKYIDDQDKKSRMDALYFERCDQANSGYALAKSILVRKDNLIITFSEKRKKRLEFPSLLILDCSNKIKQWEKGIKCLKKMSALKWINTIKFDL